MKSLRASLFALAVLVASSAAQVVGTNPNTPSPASIVVTLTPSTIAIGGTSQIQAQLLNNDSSLGSLVTSACSWSSSNTAVATVVDFTAPANPITAGYVTGVAAGTATITATCPKFSGTATITVSTPPIFQQPTSAACAAPPAVVQAGINGNPYNYQPQVTGGTGLITWSVSAGALPTGLSLNSSTGLISGTPSAVATFTPTILYTAGNGTTSCQLSITIAASTGCGAIGNGGPPTYPCTPSGVTGAFAPVRYPFSGLGSAGTCPGANCGADNTLVLDPEPVANGNTSGLYHSPTARVTNSFSGCGNSGTGEPACPGNKINVGFAVSQSDMDELHWNTDDTRFWVTDNTGGGIYFYNFNPATMVSTLACSGANASAMKVFGGGAYSRANNYTWYGLNNATDTGKGSYIAVWDMRQACPNAPTHVADMSVGGLAFNSTAVGCQPINISNPSGFDGFQHYGDCFTTNTAHNDSAQWFSDFHVDGGGNNISYTWETDASTWTRCTNNSCQTSPVVCQNCGTGITDPGHFLIHNVKVSWDGQFYLVNPGAGTCSTTCYNGNSPYIFQPSTGSVYVACNRNLTPPVGATGTCSGHWTNQLAHWVNQPNGNQMAWKTFTSSTSAFFSASQACSFGSQDAHMGNENNSGTLDDNPIYFSSSVDSAAENYAWCMAGEAVLWWPPYTTTVAGNTFKRATHLYMGPNSLTSCFAAQQGTGSISQTGKFLLYTSNMNGTLGCMNGAASGCAVSVSSPSCSYNTSQPRSDVFVQNLQ